MQNKKILIISRAFYPQNSPRSFRTTELVKEFSRQGHAVTLLTVFQKDFDYSEFLSEYPITLESIGDLRWKRFEGSKFFGDWPRKLGRLLHLFLEYPNIELLFRLKKILPKYAGFDLLISIAVPHPIHWGVAAVRTKKNPIAKTWVADCGDPFMGNTLESIRAPFYFGALENSFLKKADFVSVPTQTSVAGYNKLYHNKFRVIPQGFHFGDVDVVGVKPNHECPTFAYAGGVAGTGIRSLHQVIKFLKTIENPFAFHVYGANAKAVLKDEVRGYEKQIILHDAIARKELLYKLSEMDFLVNLDNGTHLNTPSKLIDYALALRPIMNIDPINPSHEKMTKFLEGDYSEATVINDIEAYNISNVTTKFLNLLQ